MGHETEVRAVDMVRRIRDKQARMLLGKSDAEIIEYFRQAGEFARERALARPVPAASPSKRPARRSGARTASARR